MIAALGSKEGFANLAMAITAPGDVVLVPNPAYPIHAFGFMIAGAAIRHVPATSPEEYLSQASAVPTRHSVPSPLALVVNYPSNPTAQVVELDFYKEIVKFAKKHEIWVLSDLAYADIYFDDANPPPSILQVDGAKDIAIEFQSLSKTYSMPGWRMGFAAGNEKLIGALARIKSYLDYGAFTPIQVAAAAALERAAGRGRRNPRRLQIAPRRAGEKHGAGGLGNSRAAKPRCSPGRRCRRNTAKLGSMEFAKQLLIHAKVAVSPGIGFGEYGEGYVRVALVENEHRIRQAARNVKKFLAMGTNHAPADLAAAKRSGSGEMRAPLKIAIAGLGTVGRRRGQGAGRAGRRPVGAAPGASLRSSACQRATRTRRAASPSTGWTDDPLALAKRRCRCGGRTDRRRGRHRPPAGRSRAGQWQACGDRQQGAAGQAWPGAGGAGREERRHPEIRSGGGGRHSHRQGAARRPDRPWRRCGERHPQRHLQLHPHRDGSDRAAPSPMC